MDSRRLLFSCEQRMTIYPEVMAQFIVRVELRNTKADPFAYVRLHLAMRAAGFRREIFSDGSWLRLPHAEYICESELTSLQIAKRALVIAAKVKYNPMVWVTKAAQYAFGGLKRVSPPVLETALRSRPKKILASALSPRLAAAILKRKKP